MKKPEPGEEGPIKDVDVQLKVGIDGAGVGNVGQTEVRIFTCKFEFVDRAKQAQNLATFNGARVELALDQIRKDLTVT